MFVTLRSFINKALPSETAAQVVLSPHELSRELPRDFPQQIFDIPIRYDGLRRTKKPQLPRQLTSLRITMDAEERVSWLAVSAVIIGSTMTVAWTGIVAWSAVRAIELLWL